MVNRSLIEDNFNILGPVVLGIGNVPATSIVGGYATISASYFYHVENSPFGGRLAVVSNHDKGRALGAVYYKVFYDGVLQTASWNDYKWDSATNTFVVQTSPDAFGLFPVRQLEIIWYNYWLGYYMDTNLYSDNALHTISVQFYDASFNALVNGVGSVSVFVDNNWPHAFITGVYQILDNGTSAQVTACDIIQGTSDTFYFQIDASDQIGCNLLSWSLVAYWGDNKAGAVASDTYNPGHNSVIPWEGTYYTAYPLTGWHATVSDDPTSRKCAHTFALGVWDRAIDGFLHYSSYQVSLTFFLT